ncbi:MAG: RrF2 family transcriptional regulator [Patescibacteria group bacterium]
MKFSSKTEYGLQAMVNLAKSEKLAKPAQVIAQEEKISPKYLERILNLLRKNELILSVKGKSGGYTLARPAGEISLRQIILSLDGPISPMKCIGNICHKEEKCPLKKVWTVVGKNIEETLEKIKLNDLI